MISSSLAQNSILLLAPVDDNEYLNFHCNFLGKNAAHFVRYNFVENAHRRGIPRMERQIRELVRAENITLVIASPFATDYQLSMEFLASLASTTKLVFWTFDDENYFDAFSKYVAQSGHAVITSDYFAVSEYRKLDIPAVLYFSSFSRDVYYPRDVEKTIDVSFVGDCTKNDRREYIEFLQANGVAVQTFGRGSSNGFIEKIRIPEILSQSRINLNFSKIDALRWINRDMPIIKRVRQNKGRPIEIALTRSFCLSEYSPSMNPMFEIEKEIDVFYDRKGLLEKVKYYLAHPAERNTMAENAYQKAVSSYDAREYIPRVLSEAIQLAEKHRYMPTAYLSRQFKINSVNGLTFSLFVMLKKINPAGAFDIVPRLMQYGPIIGVRGIAGGAWRVIKNMFTKRSLLL
jgi:hypothetical protein